MPNRRNSINNIELRVAVASQEGVAISEHFGLAKVFYIFDVTTAACRFVEKREVRHYCFGGNSAKSALEDIIVAIHDCAVVFVAKIGAAPAEKLGARGIRAVTDYTREEIEPSLVAYMSRQGAGTVD